MLHSLEFVDRGSETQLQVGEKLISMTYSLAVYVKNEEWETVE